MSKDLIHQMIESEFPESRNVFNEYEKARTGSFFISENHLIDLEGGEAEALERIIKRTSELMDVVVTKEESFSPRGVTLHWHPREVPDGS